VKRYCPSRRRVVMRKTFAIICSVAGLCCAGAGEPAAVTLNDLDGVARQPLEPAGKLASVVVFYGHDCPISNGYAPEINRIAASHTNFVFYIVQADADLTVAAAKEHAKEYDLRIPVLLDPKQQLIKLLKPHVTPEAFVIGSKREVLYHGRIDDLYAEIEKKRGTVTRHDLLDALDAIATGHPVKQKETPAVGCLIQ